MWKNKSLRIDREILKSKDSEGLTRYLSSKFLSISVHITCMPFNSEPATWVFNL